MPTKDEAYQTMLQTLRMIHRNMENEKEIHPLFKSTCLAYLANAIDVGESALPYQSKAENGNADGRLPE